MITPEEFRTRWGEDEFVHFPPDAVNRLNISEDVRQFLLQAGLPRQAEPMFVFDVAQNTLPTLPEYLPSYDLPPEYARYRLIGQQQVQMSDKISITEFICLDEEANGQVVCILNAEDYPASFLNTSLLHLAKMLLIYHELERWVRYDETQRENIYGSDEWRQRSRDMVSALKKVDPKTDEPQTHNYETREYPVGWCREIGEIEWCWVKEYECLSTEEGSDLFEENQSPAIPIKGVDYDISDIDESDPFADYDE